MHVLFDQQIGHAEIADAEQRQRTAGSGELRGDEHRAGVVVARRQRRNEVVQRRLRRRHRSQLAARDGRRRNGRQRVRVVGAGGRGGLTGDGGPVVRRASVERVEQFARPGVVTEHRTERVESTRVGELAPRSAREETSDERGDGDGVPRWPCFGHATQCRVARRQTRRIRRDLFDIGVHAVCVRGEILRNRRAAALRLQLRQLVVEIGFGVRRRRDLGPVERFALGQAE